MYLEQSPPVALDRSKSAGCTEFGRRAVQSGDTILLLSQELVGWARNTLAADGLRG